MTLVKVIMMVMIMVIMMMMTIMTKPMMKIGVDDKDENDELW